MSDRLLVIMRDNLIFCPSVIMSDRLPVKRGQAVLTRPFRPRNKLQATQILFLVSLSSTDPPVSSFHNPELLDLVAATMSGGGQLISVYPEELTFEFELDKPSYCNLKVVNNTEHHVAFKVKTTSPKRYFVRPNTSVIQPWDSCTITVTLQPQNEYPPDMQCKDKFLFQSTKVPPSTDMDELPPDTFSKDGDKVIEELKLRVVYMASSQSSHGNSEEDSGLTSSTSLKWDSDNLSMLKNSSIEEIQAVQHLKEERDAILQQNQQLQRELVILKRRRNRKSDAGFSLTFTAFAGLVGLMVGVILNFMFSSPPTA